MAKRDGTPDLRVKRTQKAIKESFFRLVDEKGFEHISVKDITDGAMISRNTFYLHYADKYDLLEKICDELMRSLFFRVGKQIRIVQKDELTVENCAGVIEKGLSVVSDNKDAYRILFNSISADILMEKLAAVISKFLELFISGVTEIGVLSGKYIVSGMVGIVRYYATEDFDDISGKCREFTQTHMSRVIELANKKRFNGIEQDS